MQQEFQIVFNASRKVKDKNYRIEGGIGRSGKPYTCVYEFKGFYWGQVCDISDLPRAILQLNIKAMDVAKKAASAVKPE